MASTKISAMTAATDLTGAVVPIVQGGVNKKADVNLFVQQGYNEDVEIITVSGDLQTYYQASADEGTITHGIEAIYQTQEPSVYNRSFVRLETSAIDSSVTILSSGSIKLIKETDPDQFEIIVIDSDGNILMPNLPTSSSGLTTGMLWNDNGTLKIVLP